MAYAIRELEEQNLFHNDFELRNIIMTGMDLFHS